MGHSPKDIPKHPGEDALSFPPSTVQANNLGVLLSRQVEAKQPFIATLTKCPSPTLERMFFAAWYLDESNLENLSRNFFESERRSSLFWAGPRSPDPSISAPLISAPRPPFAWGGVTGGRRVILGPVLLGPAPLRRAARLPTGLPPWGVTSSIPAVDSPGPRDPSGRVYCHKSLLRAVFLEGAAEGRITISPGKDASSRSASTSVSVKRRAAPHGGRGEPTIGAPSSTEAAFLTTFLRTYLTKLSLVIQRWYITVVVKDCDSGSRRRIYLGGRSG